MSTTPRVTVVIPARNEERFITQCVESVRLQEVGGGFEVLVVDGRSTDRTAELARAGGATVVDNPATTIPAALNLGLAAARGEILVRFDAHAEMPPGYIAACVRALVEEDAANAGGWRVATGQGVWGRAFGAALASNAGVGHAAIWREPAAGSPRRDVETVPLGCFPVERLRAVGGWAEDLLANEDYELDYRLRAAGGRIVFDPAIWSVYRPRESPGAIARQYVNYGRWKAVVLARAPLSIEPRQLAPPALVATVLAAVVPSPLRRTARLTVMAYGATITSIGFRTKPGWRTSAVLAIMHVGWGAGLLSGLPRAIMQRRGRPGRPPEAARHTPPA